MKKNRVILVSIVSNGVLIVFKIIAGILMGSVAVLSEAIHSSIDLLAAVVAYIAIINSDQPADSKHPFGHGKFENISGFFEALLIFFAAGIIAAEAVHKLINPHAAIVRLDWGIGVMAISAAVNVAVSRMLFYSAKKYGSIAIEADAMHLGADVMTSVGVMLGLVAIRFSHLVVLDPLIAIAVAGLILRASINLTRRSIADLADQKLPDGEIGVIETIIHGYPEITSYHKLRTRKSGSRREIDLHIRVDGNTSLTVAHELCFKVENAVKVAFPGAYVTIHVEPGRGEPSEKKSIDT
jgi:cation diffusion facilitator family transporter